MSRKGHRAFHIEPLEERRLLAVDMVTSNLDDGSAGTLRAVIAAAASGDTIEFDSGITEIDLTQGQIEINTDLTIEGPGASSLTINQATTTGPRLFQIDATDGNGDGVTVALSGMELTGENAGSAIGGGIDNRGNLSLTDMVLVDNLSYQGAALYNEGGATATLVNNTLSNNNATDGAGCYNFGTLNLNDCTLSNDVPFDGRYGGAIDNLGLATVSGCTFSQDGNDGVGGAIFSQDSLSVIDSTFSGNNAQSGGGIFNVSQATINDSTFSGNSADQGGGIDNSGTMNLANTILVGNTATSGDADVSGSFDATDHDLIGTLGDASGFTTSGTTASIVLGSDDTTAAGLGPLADNGGPTQTMALLDGSPAIAAGDAALTAPFSLPATDQRGNSRTINGTVDIGAYERQLALMADPVSVAVNAFDTATFTASAVGTPAPDVTWQVSTDGGNTWGSVPDATDTTLSLSDVLVSQNGYEYRAVFSNSDGTDATLPATLTVTAVTPTIASLGDVGITYGTALADSQLNGTATFTIDGQPVTVDGSFSYTSAGGTVLQASSTAYTEDVTFTPTDTSDYTNATGTATVNVAMATPTITPLNAVNITYGAVLSDSQLLSGTASFIVNDQAVNVPGTFTYTSAGVTLLQASSNGYTENVTFTPTDTTDYTNATGTVTADVGQATPKITWSTPAGITYGTALSATQLNAAASWTVAGTLGSVDGDFVYSPAGGTVLGGGNRTLQVTFTPTDTTDYTTANHSVTLTVKKATPTITQVNPVDITYGTALTKSQLSGTASFIVNGQAVNVPGTFTFTSAGGTVLQASGNGYTENITFTPTDTTDYANASGTVTVDVGIATPKINWSTPTAIAFGTALSGTQLDANPSWTVGGHVGGVAGTLVYSLPSGTVLPVGDYALDVAFTPQDTADYNATTDSVTLVVKQATPAINWPAPAAVYGTALGGEQLDASSSSSVDGIVGSVPGTFTYSPPAGTLLAAGDHTLSVTFTPKDTADFTTATKSVTLVVHQATPTITWSTPAAIAYGTALSATQLDAASSWTVGGKLGSVAGNFVYSPAAGAVLAAGNQTLHVTFTPTDTTDFTTAKASVVIDVKQAATKTAVSSSASPAVYGQPVTFAAAVTNAGGTSPTPTGNVQFVVDGQDFGNPVKLDATGHATSGPIAFSSGSSHSVRVNYLPANGNFAQSTGSLTQKVQKEALQTDPLSPSKTDLFVGDTSASSDAQIGMNNGQIAVNLHDGSSVFQTPLSGVNALVVYGEAPNEQIAVASQLTLPAFLFGGNGGSVHIVAGGGPTVEVGGSAANNFLEGGPIADLLIAGQGGGELLSHGGNDILIGGHTNFDGNLAALEAVMAEWSRTDVSYSARISDLLGTSAGGLNGAFNLNAHTVHDNGISDQLSGGAGADWFFAHLAGTDADQVGTLTAAEKATEVGIV